VIKRSNILKIPWKVSIAQMVLLNQWKSAFLQNLLPKLIDMGAPLFGMKQKENLLSGKLVLTGVLKV
jgi:hypothetical protein